MKIELVKSFARNSAAAEYDVMQIKKALNRLGYYYPHDESSGITNIPNNEMFEALKKFQADKGLNATSMVKPDDETIDAINHEIAKTPEGYYIWRTAEDFGCRCWAQRVPEGVNAKAIYDDAVEPIYPEVFLIPLLPVKRLYTAWKIWNEVKEAGKIEWTLGAHKSEIKWANQFKNRDWKPEQITRTIRYGKKYDAPNKIKPDNGATRFEYGDRYVVRDNKTKDILQVSGKNFVKSKINGR